MQNHYQTEPTVIMKHASGRLQNSRRYPNDVSLEIYPGKLIKLQGKNKAGKSSLLKTLAFVNPITQGYMRIFDCDIYPRRKKKNHLLKGYVHYIPQKDYALQENLSAVENIIYELEESWKYDQPIERIAWEVLEKVQPQDEEPFDIHSKISELSYGTQARVGVAIALAKGYPLILADELFADIHEEAIPGLLELLRTLTLVQSASTVVISLNTTAFDRFFDGFITVENGRVIYSGPDPHPTIFDGGSESKREPNLHRDDDKVWDSAKQGKSALWVILAMILVAVITFISFTNMNNTCRPPKPPVTGRTATNPPSTSRPLPSLTPCPSPIEKAQAVVRAYYDAVNKHDYQYAYDMWGSGSDVRRFKSPDQFNDGFAHTRQVTIKAFDNVTPQPDNTVKVAMRIQADEEINDTGRISVYRWNYTVGQEDGTWKLLKETFSQES